MMKSLIFIIAGIVLLLNLWSCSQSDKTKILEQYKYEESKDVSNDLIVKRIGPWVKEGMTCYGIVVVHGENGLAARAKEVKAKVISIQSDKVKMRSLENVIMNQVEGCNKFSLKEGEDWDEIEGDLFQTKEEAIKFIDDNFPGLRMK